MDADIGAAVAQAGAVMWRVMDPAQRPSGELGRFYQTPKRPCSILPSESVRSFACSGTISVPTADADIETYPPWRVRQMIAIASATYFISRRWNHVLAVSCQQAMKEAMLHVEHAYCQVTGKPMATKGLTEAWDGTGWRHVQNKLIAHWRDELYDRVASFQFHRVARSWQRSLAWR